MNNNFKKSALTLVLMLTLIACGTTESAIQTAIAQTQVVQTKDAESIPTGTKQPTRAISPTKSSLFATLTAIAKIPSKTPVPKITYIVTTGSCLGYESRYIPVGDPVGFEFCDTDERKQWQLASGDTVTYASFMPYKYPSFCAIHTLDGLYEISNVDINGLGKAVCTLP